MCKNWIIPEGTSGNNYSNLSLGKDTSQEANVACFLFRELSKMYFVATLTPASFFPLADDYEFFL